MKTKIFLFCGICALLLSLSCVREEIYDETQTIENRQWRTNQKVRFELNITNTETVYDLIFNLRHTDKYRYSNIFVLVHITSPDHKTTTERVEFMLAQPDGRWYGYGSATIAIRSMLKRGYKFTQLGKYNIEIEQNMRDNPLENIVGVGVAIKRSEKN